MIKTKLVDMHSKMMESYLDNIAEQVADEDKIVTYKSLSRSLGVHVNTAKQLLHTYLANEKSKNSFPISATYLVAGKVVDGSYNITIVNEADLKDAYSTFLEITSEHVYSVQKGKTLKDVKLLCGISKESNETESSKLVITCSKAVQKSSKELKRKPECHEESNKKIIKQALLPEKKTVNLPETVKPAETNKNKETSSKSPKKISPKGNSHTTQVKKPTGNIANLFAKAAQKNAGMSVPIKKPEKNTEPEVDVEMVEPLTEEKVEPQKSKTFKQHTKSKESLKKNKKGNKRKRIQMLSDSEDTESDDEEEKEDEKVDVEEDDDILPCSLNLEEEKDEANESIPKNKRKKRKVIDKTVMNEDGYLETKKEVVFETDSENEVEEPKTASREQKNPKVDPVIDKGKAPQSSGLGKKQSSLLTFFKKS